MIKIESLDDLKNFYTSRNHLPESSALICSLDSLLLKTVHAILDTSLDISLQDVTLSVKNKSSHQYRSDLVSFQTRISRNQNPLPSSIRVSDQNSSMAQWLEAHPSSKTQPLNTSKPITLSLRVENSQEIPIHIQAQWQALATKAMEIQYSQAMLYDDQEENNRFLLAHANLLLQTLHTLYQTT